MGPLGQNLPGTLELSWILRVRRIPSGDHEKGEGLFRKGEQGERWGGKSKKRDASGMAPLPISWLWHGTMLLSCDGVKALSVFIIPSYNCMCIWGSRCLWTMNCYWTMNRLGWGTAGHEAKELVYDFRKQTTAIKFILEFNSTWGSSKLGGQ